MVATHTVYRATHGVDHEPPRHRFGPDPGM